MIILNQYFNYHEHTFKIFIQWHFEFHSCNEEDLLNNLSLI